MAVEWLDRDTGQHGPIIIQASNVHSQPFRVIARAVECMDAAGTAEPVMGCVGAPLVKLQFVFTLLDLQFGFLCRYKKDALFGADRAIAFNRLGQRCRFR